MTPQEHQLLQDFLRQLTQVRGTVKDPEAEALIARAATEQPDALYLLVQRSLLLEQGLNSAKAQIAQLQSQLNTGTNSSFLNSSGWGPQSQAPAPMAAYPQMQNAPRAGLFGGGTGSFLGNVAATAAGVVGGAFLFQGIENLLGHHNNSSLLGQNSLMDNAVDNTRTNDRYIDDNSNNALGDNSDLDSLADVDTDNFDSGDDSSLI